MVKMVVKYHSFSEKAGEILNSFNGVLTKDMNLKTSGIY